MKKKLIAIVLMILTCAAFALGFTACGGGNNDIPADGNMAKVVLREDDSEGETEMIGHYVPKGAVNTWGHKYLNYTMDDIIGSNLPFNNYGILKFCWNSGNYKITKIEFDLIVERNYKAILSLGNPNTISEVQVNMNAGQKEHIVFTVNMLSNNYVFFIGMGQGSDVIMREVNIKISNFYVTAEKV